MSVTDDEVAEYLAKQQIYDRLVDEARGLDRGDATVVGAAYHDDAVVDHGFFSGSGPEYAAFVGPYWQSQGIVHQTHRLDNVLVEFASPDVAAVSSYNLRFLQSETPEGPITTYLGGRYLDRFECRDGSWRIAHRTYVLDWNRVEPSTVDWTGSYFGELALGRRDRSDDSYASMPRLP